MHAACHTFCSLFIAASAECGSVEETEVYFSGHSLGGALATLATLDMCRRGIDGRQPKSVTVSDQILNDTHALLSY
jgi:alpha-beta hydrolase superfamily lysophospholipase